MTNPKELMDEIVEKFNKKFKDNYKIVYVDKTYWTNVITKRKGTINDLYFFGALNNSGKPVCITKFVLNGKVYKLHDLLNHVNLSQDEEIINIGHGFNVCLNSNEKVTFYGQSFCNPITRHHVYTNPHIDKILKGQLMGQNSDSPMQYVRQCCNEGQDEQITDERGRLIKARATCLELITKLSGNYISRNLLTTQNKLRELLLPQNENECMVKLRRNSYYTAIKKSNLHLFENELSSYYPVIEFEQIKNILDELPKTEVDFTVIGLGSAGTGVLDQVGRSTYFNKFMLIDFDRVEGKNLRNQWYRACHISQTKTSASRDVLKNINPNPTEIMEFTSRFESVVLNNVKSKYVVSGFDNLECRLKLLDYVTSGKFEVDYLIDLRYLDYECSIYFVDLKDENQVKYYRNLLESDIEEFKESDKTNYVQTKEQLEQYWIGHSLHIRGCLHKLHEFFGESTCNYQSNEVGCGCCDRGCMNYLWSCFERTQPKIPLSTETESSCVRQNFIDIYKYASSFVFAAIREIEGGNPKPFTHVEAQTDVLPTSMVVRK